MQRRLTTLAGGLVILLAALYIYQPLLFPANPEQIYPWGSDTWGHLVKAVYLGQQISLGNYYPDLFPGWYNGIQMLRYHAPLPYYLLTGLARITGDIWKAGNIFLFLTSLGGGLAFLLYRRWLGWLPAVAAGVLFLALPDNLRVAFAEGNLPRALATALLPITFYFFLKLIMLGGRRSDFIAVAACVSLIVLSHAMMAAIFLAGCGIFAVIFWILARTSFTVVARGALALVAGLLVSGWWLFPSLTGGITEIDQQAATEALARFPLSVSLNPSLRTHNHEAYYLGLSLLLGLALAAALWKKLDPWLRALTVTAFITILISSTAVNGLYNALPFHHLFWPIRFLSFGGFALLLVTAGVASWLWRHSMNQRINLCQCGVLALLVIILADFSPSLRLVQGRELPPALLQFSYRLKELEGWRVATADLSRLGSAPSYLFAYPGGREQVFGWAFQGSVTAPLLARINQAIVKGYSSYALDRLSILGTDDVVLLRQPEIPSDFAQRLEAGGYRLEQSAHDLELYHRDGAPRAYTIPYKVLGIGRGAENLALLFPEVVVGGSEYLDDYGPAFLDQFDQLFLSGFRWRDRNAAEQRVKGFMERGGERVVVDLTGVPNDVLSRQPKFLGVYGEPALAISQANLIIAGQMQTLRPFDRQPWITHAPHGVDQSLVSFTYPVTSGAALGVKYLGEHEVHFIGLNLVFHALLTHDPVAVSLLEEVFGLSAGQMPARQIVPLTGYQTQEGGYRFEYSLPRDTEVLIPIVHHSGARVYIDGQLMPSQSIDRLTLASFKAGVHQVEVRSEEVPAYNLGRAASVVGLLVILAYAAGLRQRHILRLFQLPRETSPYATGS